MVIGTFTLLEYRVILKKVSFGIFEIIVVSKEENNYTMESKDKVLSLKTFSWYLVIVKSIKTRHIKGHMSQKNQNFFHAKINTFHDGKQGSSLIGNRRGQSPLEYRGNLSVHPSVHQSVCPSVHPSVIHPSERPVLAPEGPAPALERPELASEKP